jgi:hypothetical protein
MSVQKIFELPPMAHGTFLENGNVRWRYHLSFNFLAFIGSIESFLLPNPVFCFNALYKLRHGFFLVFFIRRRESCDNSLVYFVLTVAGHLKACDSVGEIMHYSVSFPLMVGGVDR